MHRNTRYVVTKNQRFLKLCREVWQVNEVCFYVIKREKHCTTTRNLNTIYTLMHVIKTLAFGTAFRPSLGPIRTSGENWNCLDKIEGQVLS